MLHTPIELTRKNEREPVDRNIVIAKGLSEEQKTTHGDVPQTVVTDLEKCNVPSQRNWNIPMADEEPQPTTPDQQASDPSRTSMPDASVPMQAPYETGPTRQPEVEAPMHSQDPGSSRLSHPDDESYALPQHSASSAPRMIQQSSSGRTASQNAFKRLKSMGSLGEGSEKLPALPPPGDLGPYGYPTTAKNEKPKTQYPGYKTYQVTRCFCCFTTFVSVFLVVCAIITIIFAIVKMDKDCKSVSVMIVLMDIILLVIVTLEWIRLWIWREPTPLSSSGTKCTLAAEASMGPTNSGGGLPIITNIPGPIANPTYPNLSANSNPVGGFLTFGFQQRLYDVPQFVSALCLIVLYAIGGLFIVGTMAAAGANLSKCTELGLCGISFGAILAILLCMRMVMCCLSDACRGLCHRTASNYSKSQVPMVAVNQLHQVLPEIGKHWHSGGESSEGRSPPNVWLMNLSGATDPRQQLSIIQPLPAQYANDLTR